MSKAVLGVMFEVNNIGASLLCVRESHNLKKDRLELPHEEN